MKKLVLVIEDTEISQCPAVEVKQKADADRLVNQIGSIPFNGAIFIEEKAGNTKVHIYKKVTKRKSVVPAFPFISKFFKKRQAAPN